MHNILINVCIYVHVHVHINVGVYAFFIDTLFQHGCLSEDGNEPNIDLAGFLKPDPPTVASSRALKPAAACCSR